MNTKAQTPQEKFEAARAAIADGEARSLSESTMRKRWKAYFAAEDALKSGMVWR